MFQRLRSERVSVYLLFSFLPDFQAESAAERDGSLHLCLCIMYLAYQSKKKKRTFILVQQQQEQPHVARSCTSATRSGLHKLPALILTQNAEDLRWMQPLRG